MGDNISRRSFVKTVIIGGAASCAIGAEWLQAQPTATFELHGLPGSENFAPCHAVRDGTVYSVPPPSRMYEAVIVAGGPSGLMAAYRLRDKDILLLEKEPWVGGNALDASWKGIEYSTGATLIYGSRSHPRLLCEELGIRPTPLPFNPGGRVYFVDGRRIQNVEEEFARQYPHATKSFAQFKKDMVGMDVSKNRSTLDGVSFAEVLRPYDPAVREWHDIMVDWLCCDSSTTSGLGGVLMAQHWLGVGFHVLLSPEATDDERVTFPGGMGYLAKKLTEKIEQAGGGRIVTNAMVYRVAPTQDGQAEVSYLRDGRPVTVKAKTVIVAAPKLIARHIVQGLSEEQTDAMGQLSYAPYIVAALCSDRALPNDIAGARCLKSVIGAWDVPDWIEHNAKRDVSQPELVRAIVPRRPSQRATILADAGVHKLANEVVDYFESYYPGIRDKLAEIRMHRRGHNWFVPVPGAITKYQPQASQPLGCIAFAHADSVGPISDFDWAIVAADRAVQQVSKFLKRSSTIG